MMKQIPSKPFLQSSEEIMDLISLRNRFRAACRTILASAPVHVSARRMASEALKLEQRQSIEYAAADILVLLETQLPTVSHLVYVAMCTLRTIAAKQKEALVRGNS